MPRKKKTGADAVAKEEPAKKEETRIFQVTLQKDGKVAGTEKRALTKKQAIDLGHVWT